MTIADKDRDFQVIKQAALDQEWKVERTNGNHYRFLAPDGHTAVTAGGSYKDRHALKNLVAQLRRGGFVAPKKMR
jgi:hypothetical protein